MPAAIVCGAPDEIRLMTASCQSDAMARAGRRLANCGVLAIAVMLKMWRRSWLHGARSFVSRLCGLWFGLAIASVTRSLVHFDSV